MYISGAGQPIRSSDALPLLLDSVFCGGDVILVNGGGEENELLDRAATRLAKLRSRVLWASDVLPDGSRTSMHSHDMAGRSRLSIPDDEFLTRSYRALTVLDEGYDRIVLLIGDAHALQHSALRYIQFVSRSCGHLQLVFCGTCEFPNLLEVENLSWLRTRLLEGQVIALATPIVRAVPFLPDIQAARIGKMAAFRLSMPKPRFITNMSSRNVRLVPLALFSLVGAAWLTLCVQNGAKTGPTTSRQDIVQPTTSKPIVALAPNTQKNRHVVTRAAPETDPAALDASASHSSDMADDARVTGLTSPFSKLVKSPSTMVSKNLFSARPDTRTSANKPGFTEPPVPNGLSGLGDEGVSAASQHASDAAIIHLPYTLQPRVLSRSARRASDMAASNPISKAPLAVTKAGLNPVVVTGSVRSANPRPSLSIPILPSSGAAPGTTVAALPQARTGLPLSERSGLQGPEAVPAPDFGWHSVSAVPLHSAAIPGRRARQFKLLAKQDTPLAADDPWLTPQPVSSSGDGSQRYIGSYATDANGVRVFRPDP